MRAGRLFVENYPGDSAWKRSSNSDAAPRCSPKPKDDCSRNPSQAVPRGQRERVAALLQNRAVEPGNKSSPHGAGLTTAVLAPELHEGGKSTAPRVNNAAGKKHRGDAQQHGRARHPHREGNDSKGYVASGERNLQQPSRNTKNWRRKIHSVRASGAIRAP